MTGIEHYREAEKLLAGQQSARRGSPEDMSALAEAQVHATLALAAAVALKPPSRSKWGKAAGRQEDGR